MDRKSFSIPAIGIIIACAFLIGAVVILVSLQLKGQPVKLYSFEEPKLKDETADWQIYRNEEYGFEIKYPEDWEISENKLLAPMEIKNIRDEGQAKVSPVVSFYRDKSKKYNSINEVYDEMDFNNSNWNREYIITKEINGINFYGYTWMHQSQGETLLAIINGDLFTIRFTVNETYYSLEEYYAYSKFNKIVSTFRFID